ncbi:hypothetical protein [Micromonospora sp. WMMD1082]|uniref:hypothetical protein n=1 Tax=Micromonospora sp. WMMD1082 TaxID=3016104 RepID=UPI00241683E6|nr:hypothetical protein [Micromonospora sp. WMMD1082]MDG4794975.1 hypothetical protein [Micromonospora sp. WMMD1082]
MRKQNDDPAVPDRDLLRPWLVLRLVLDLAALGADVQHHQDLAYIFKASVVLGQTAADWVANRTRR